jgi:integral membrane sensor domain MASE1
LACHRSRRHQRRSSPLTGYLIERWFNGPFAFHDVRHVVGVIAAAGFGAAVYGIAGGAAVNLLSTTAPFWEVWRSWSLSGAVGSVMVAPLLIGLAQLWRERPSKGEWSEGLGGSPSWSRPVSTP